ncbi:MAG: beta-galactosidase, partial [Erysipelotrichaceae bacterium]|nr:beta-galactosidase [Erysipelotrichaceae bacterium]
MRPCGSLYDGDRRIHGSREPADGWRIQMRYLGVDYYPEQWGMKLVDEDLDNIVELGLDLIRIGDFAWDRMEPREGEYDFSF